MRLKIISATILAILLLTASPQIGPVHATSMYQSHAPILIIGNTQFTASNGITGGSGTTVDPYVIGGWEINASSNGIGIYNTTAYFSIRNVSVHSGIRGIFLTNTTHATVRDSVVSTNTNGIVIQQSPGAIVSGNTLVNNLNGISLVSSSGASVSSNMVSLNFTITSSNIESLAKEGSSGIGIGSSPSSTVTSNTVTLDLTNYQLYNSPESCLPPYSCAFPTYSRLIFSALLIQSSATTLVSSNTLSSNGGYGIDLASSPNSVITGNRLEGNVLGLADTGSVNSTISRNNVTRNLLDGIALVSGNTTLSGNNVSFNGLGVGSPNARGLGRELSGLYIEAPGTVVTGNNFTANGLILESTYSFSPAYFSSQKIPPNNLVNGKPLYYYTNCTGLRLNGIPVGQLIIANCSNVQVSGLQITETDVGIQLLSVNGVLIEVNTINSNNITGISFGDSTGTCCPGSSNVTIIYNNFSNNAWINVPHLGIENGASLVHHNNFLYDAVEKGPWDNGYPSGGNYWSDYSGVDNCSGPSQNICPNPDGIGDTPFMYKFFDTNPYAIIGPNITDRYPLMKPYQTTQDKTPPTWIPRSLTVSNVNETNVTLSWRVATDDLGVVSYRIYKDDTLLTTVSAYTYTWTISGLTPGTTYTFRVEALDYAGNQSVGGPSATLITPGSQPWTQYVYPVAVVIGSSVAILVLSWFAKRRKRTLPLTTA